MLQHGEHNVLWPGGGQPLLGPQHPSSSQYSLSASSSLTRAMFQKKTQKRRNADSCFSPSTFCVSNTSQPGCSLTAHCEWYHSSSHRVYKLFTFPWVLLWAHTSLQWPGSWSIMWSLWKNAPLEINLGSDQTAAQNTYCLLPHRRHHVTAGEKGSNHLGGFLHVSPFLSTSESLLDIAKFHFSQMTISS